MPQKVGERERERENDIVFPQVLPLVEVEMEAGDALFFHSNVLHRSDKNDSDRRRWAFLIAYNRASNNPVYQHYLKCTKLEKVILLYCLSCMQLMSYYYRY